MDDRRRDGGTNSTLRTKEQGTHLTLNEYDDDDDDDEVFVPAKYLAGTYSLFIIYIYNKPTRCDSGSIVFIKNYKYALHVSDALCVHLQEHYKL